MEIIGLWFKVEKPKVLRKPFVLSNWIFLTLIENNSRIENHFSFGNPGVGGHLDVMVYTWTSLVKLITKHVLSFYAKNKTKQKNKAKKQKQKQKQHHTCKWGCFYTKFHP